LVLVVKNLGQKELSIINNEAFTIYSGMNINAGEQNGLNGECDFMLSFSRIQDFVIAPIFSITEAKKQDIEQGTRYFKSKR